MCWLSSIFFSDHSGVFPDRGSSLSALRLPQRSRPHTSRSPAPLRKTPSRELVSFGRHKLRRLSASLPKTRKNLTHSFTFPCSIIFKISQRFLCQEFAMNALTDSRRPWRSGWGFCSFHHVVDVESGPIRSGQAMATWAPTHRLSLCPGLITGWFERDEKSLFLECFPLLLFSPVALLTSSWSHLTPLMQSASHKIWHRLVKNGINCKNENSR